MIRRFLVWALRPIILQVIDEEMKIERHRLDRLWKVHMELYFGGGDPVSLDAYRWLKQAGLCGRRPSPPRDQTRLGEG